MAMVHPMTRTGSRPASGITDAHFDAYYAVRVDSSNDNRNRGDRLEVPYRLTGTTANTDEVYGVLGNKDSNISATQGARDTIITGGIVPVRLAAAYDHSSMGGRGVGASTTAGVVQAVASGGRGRLVGGGTLSVNGTTVNVGYLDLDAR